MARTKIVDRSPVQILLDHGWTDVRSTRNCRCISQSLADGAHDAGNRALALRFRLPHAPFGESDCGEQRSAPGPEILRRELLSEVCLDVLVQAPAAEAAELALSVAKAKQPSPALRVEKSPNRVGQLRVDDRRPHEGAVLAVEAEGDPAATDAHVSLAQRRDSERPESPRVALVPDAKPAEVDQPDCDGRGPLEREWLEPHVLGHRGSELGEPLGEPDQL